MNIIGILDEHRMDRHWFVFLETARAVSRGGGEHSQRSRPMNLTDLAREVGWNRVGTLTNELERRGYSQADDDGGYILDGDHYTILSAMEAEWGG